MQKEIVYDECYLCRWSTGAADNSAHLCCLKPDATITGSREGCAAGVFCYPESFNPFFKTSKCSNFTPQGGEICSGN